MEAGVILSNRLFLLLIGLSACSITIFAQYSLRRYQPLCNRCGCCNSVKPRYVNPCSQGPPILTPYGQPAYCNWKVPNSCPSSHFCHVGTTVVTTCCCPQPGDPCDMPPSSGQGQAALPRFFFDKSTRSCKPFMYRGLLGNANNFISREICETTCPALKSPCALPVPPGPPSTCSVVAPNTCPPGFWCHIGFSADTTTCCPGAGSPCPMPLLTGQGFSSLPRWYFDVQVGACRQFNYLGTKGNQNNFLTREACEATCRPLENPCQAPIDPANAVSCSPPGINPTPCPPGLWCHLGATPQTTLCCPGVGNPCEQPRAEGTGPAALQRFYYDQIQRTCLPFTYRGLKGNQNNFLSLQDCQALCFTLINPCPVGEPLIVAGQARQCAPTSPCPSTHWCHIGAGPDTTVCCLITGDPCRMPRAEGLTGRIPVSLSRWYFDQNTRQCQTFIYLGLKGNQNNFPTLDSCQQTCAEINPCQPPDTPFIQPGDGFLRCQGRGSFNNCPATHFCLIGSGPETSACCPSRGSPCDQPQVQGMGVDQLPRWSYDAATDECISFTYRGIQGNENNFLSLGECEDTCSRYKDFCPHGKPLIIGQEPQTCSIETACPEDFVCHINAAPQISLSTCCPAPASFCFLPRDPGQCNQADTRFGYDPNSNTCVQFRYGGCGGNLNNFRSLEKCTDICCNQF